jgi:hypothetical protein
MLSLVIYQIINIVFVYKSHVDMLLCKICSSFFLKSVSYGTFYIKPYKSIVFLFAFAFLLVIVCRCWLC